jgi:hypothetical protein
MAARRPGTIAAVMRAPDRKREGRLTGIIWLEQW